MTTEKEMYDILTVGSGTVDVFVDTKTKEIRQHNDHADVCYHIGDKVLIKSLKSTTGGGGTNTAVAFRRMGYKTAWLGNIGIDPNRYYILEDLERERVDFVGHCVPGQSGYSVIMTGLQHDRTVFAYKGVNDEVKLSDKQVAAVRAKWFYFSSMIGKSFESQKKLARHAQTKHIPYAYNPSCYLTEKGLGVLGPLVKGAHVLILNAQEAANLLKTDPAHVKSNAQRLADYARIAIVTDGPRVAYASDGAKFYSITPRKVSVVETTGAGDAFASGVVSGLMRDESLQDSLRIGAANSENVIQHIGAKAGLFTRKSAATFIRKHPVRIREENS